MSLYFTIFDKQNIIFIMFGIGFTMFDIIDHFYYVQQYFYYVFVDLAVLYIFIDFIMFDNIGFTMFNNNW